MKLTKVHCPTHTEYNLTMFGLNQNTNLGPCESGHKEHIKNAKLMQCQKDKLDEQIIVLLHATALVDVVNKSTIAAMDLNVDSIGDRHVGGTTFSVIISEDENYNGEATLLREFRWTSRHKQEGSSITFTPK